MNEGISVKKIRTNGIKQATGNARNKGLEKAKGDYIDF